MTENGKRKPICPYADRAENLERRNEILETGQRVYDIDNKKSKIGDGEKHWNDLPWESTGGGSSVTIDIEITDSATDANVPSTKAVKTELDKKLDKTDAVGKKTAEGGEIFNSATSAGSNAHAEGGGSATGAYSHAEGSITQAKGLDSHAEGFSTTAEGDYSHTEGFCAIAKGEAAHAEGYQTKASSKYQHVQGKNNIEDTANKYAHIVGNGTADFARSNAHTLDWDGNAWYAGNVTVGGTYNSETGVVDGAKELVDEEVIERIKYYDDPNIIPSDESYFTVNETGETITGLSDTGKTQTELVIPYKINGKEITNLDSESALKSILDGNTVITKVVIPSSVTSIGEYAFRGCQSLISIDIPNSVTSIGGEALQECSSLISIDIPNSVTSIGGAAFRGCQSLTSIDIPNSVTSIEDETFAACSLLTSLNIPNSVTSIGGATLADLTNLTIYCEQGSYAATYANTNNIPAIYTDVKASTLVGQKTVAGGEIFNDYTNNKAAVYSHAEGFETVAGQMGHLITDDGWGNSTSKTYTLTSVDGLEVNDTVSMFPAMYIINNVAELSESVGLYSDFAKITAIDADAKTITVDTYQSRQSNYGVIYVTSKPSVGTTAVIAYSHAEGFNVTASGNYSHAEGYNTTASGIFGSHAEGGGTTASGNYSHAEGTDTTASGNYSHAEGSSTKSNGESSHAEGYSTIASGQCSHVEGHGTTAGGSYSHAEGQGTVVYNPSQHVQGKFNVDDHGNYAHIVGNGSSTSSRSNAHTLDWNGNAWFAGNVRVGGTYTNGAGIVGAKELATKEYVDTTAVETSVTDPIVVNTIYSLGEQSSLTIELPTGTFGNFIQFDFISGSTATTLSITPTDGLIGNNLVPNANTIYTLYLDWGIVGYTDSSTIKYGWRLNYFEYPLETF